MPGLVSKSPASLTGVFPTKFGGSVVRRPRDS